MPILLIVLFAAATEKAVIFTDVNFCLFNGFEVPVSQPNFKTVKKSKLNRAYFCRIEIFLRNGYGFLENIVQNTVEF